MDLSFCIFVAKFVHLKRKRKTRKRHDAFFVVFPYIKVHKGAFCISLLELLNFKVSHWIFFFLGFPSWNFPSWIALLALLYSLVLCLASSSYLTIILWNLFRHVTNHLKIFLYFGLFPLEVYLILHFSFIFCMSLCRHLHHLY